MQGCSQFARLVLVGKCALTVQLDLHDISVVAVQTITFHLAESFPDPLIWLGLVCVHSHERQVGLLLFLGLFLGIGDIQSLKSFDLTLNAGGKLVLSLILLFLL